VVFGEQGALGAFGLESDFMFLLEFFLEETHSIQSFLCFFKGTRGAAILQVCAGQAMMLQGGWR
jgi:hypothetical protein